MKARDKAKELVCKMYGCEIDADLQKIYIINTIGYFIAKDSALVAVDEIMQEMDNVMLPNPFKQYWEQVKQEISKL